MIKRATGNDEQAGIDATDFLRNLNHNLTDKRFQKKRGVNLEKVSADTNKRRVSP